MLCSAGIFSWCCVPRGVESAIWNPVGNSGRVMEDATNTPPSPTHLGRQMLCATFHFSSHVHGAAAETGRTAHIKGKFTYKIFSLHVSNNGNWKSFKWNLCQSSSSSFLHKSVSRLSTRIYKKNNKIYIQI